MDNKQVRLINNLEAGIVAIRTAEFYLARAQEISEEIYNIDKQTYNRFFAISNVIEDQLANLEISELEEVLKKAER